jgi:DNA-binding NtrC family response regulator
MARILVIDDDEAIRSVLTMLISQKNHEVVTAQDGRRGLKATTNDHFDLLIIDIFMPEMDGLEAMRLVRKDRPDLPIIVMSGSGNRDTLPDFLAMATKLGAIESIPKPFRPAELFEVVEKSLHHGSANKTASSP